MNRKSASILLIGREKKSELADALFSLGFELVARESMFGALKRIRSSEFAAIVIDRHSVDYDGLELALNVRDIDAETPIIVVGRADDPDADGRLRALRRISVLDDIESVEVLSSKMEILIAKGRNED